MIVNRVCATCGREIVASTTVSGLCAACLFRLALPLTAAPSIPGSPDCRVLSVLGAGKRAVSYLAEAGLHGEHHLVVLKIFDTERSDGFGSAFAARLEAILAVRHRGHAITRQFGLTSASRPFMVRDFVSGMPLLSFLGQSDSSLSTRRRLFSEIVEAVSHLHQSGVLHGRLSPTNIIVSSADGQPRAVVVDLGAPLVEAAHGAEPGVEPTFAADTASLAALAHDLGLSAGDEREPT